MQKLFRNGSYVCVKNPVQNTGSALGAAWLLSLGFRLFTVCKEVSRIPARKRQGIVNKYESVELCRLSWFEPSIFTVLICWDCRPNRAGDFSPRNLLQ